MDLNKDTVLNSKLEKEDNKFLNNSRNEIKTIRCKADLDDLDVKTYSDTEYILQDGFLTDALRVSNHIRCIYEFDDDESINLYDGCLKRYNFYQKLIGTKCSFLIKILDNLENRSSFYHIGRCLEMPDDGIYYQKFTEYIGRRSDIIFVYDVFRSINCIFRKNFKVFFISSDKGLFALFLNHVKENFKVSSIGIDLKNYFPLTEVTCTKFLNCLNQTLVGEKVKVAYITRMEGNSIEKLELESEVNLDENNNVIRNENTDANNNNIDIKTELNFGYKSEIKQEKE